MYLRAFVSYTDGCVRDSGGLYLDAVIVLR